MGWDGPVTHRQHTAHLAYEDMQWNQPSRTDHYLARLACELRRIPFSVWGRSVTLDPKDFILKFVTAGEKDRPVSDEQQKVLDEMSKARWRSFLGRKEAGHNGHRD